MNTALLHALSCDWHVDQYPQECTCGALPVYHLVVRDKRHIHPRHTALFSHPVSPEERRREIRKYATWHGLKETEVSSVTVYSGPRRQL